MSNAILGLLIGINLVSSVVLFTAIYLAVKFFKKAVAKDHYTFKIEL